MMEHGYVALGPSIVMELIYVPTGPAAFRYAQVYGQVLVATNAPSYARQSSNRRQSRAFPRHERTDQGPKLSAATGEPIAYPDFNGYNTEQDSMALHTRYADTSLH